MSKAGRSSNGRTYPSGGYYPGSSPGLPALLATQNTKSDIILIMYFTYILECADKSLYVGCTNNLERRLEQHNNSKSGAHYTKTRRPVVLLYSEIFSTLKEARRKEVEIKGWRREKKLELILRKPKGWI